MIAVFAVDPSNGALIPVQHISSGGETPRRFAIDPVRTFLFAPNQNSRSTAIVRIAVSGRLHPRPRWPTAIESTAGIVLVEAHHE